MVTVRSARRVDAISRSIACCNSEGTAKMPMLATAIASVRTVKNARALRRVRSVTDLRRHRSGGHDASPQSEATTPSRIVTTR